MVYFKRKKMKEKILLTTVAIIVFIVLILKDAGSGAPRWLAELIILAESGGNPKAVGPIGERGLFQFRESTWSWFTKKTYGEELDFDLAFDSRINRKVGMEYLKWLKEQIDTHYTPALLAGSFHYGLTAIKRLGYELPASAYTHPNLIYRKLFRKES